MNKQTEQLSLESALRRIGELHGDIERLTNELEHARVEARAMHSAYETSVRLRALLRRSWFKSVNDEPNLQEEVLRYFDEQPD